MSEFFYPIFSVELPEMQQYEQMGSKRKFWYLDAKQKKAWLFKYARVNSGVTTGEDWAEKVGCEVAELLGLPHARVELAECQGERGTVSERFVDKAGGEQLVHGNELLVQLDASYPVTGGYYETSQHTVDNIVSALSRPSVELPTMWSVLELGQGPVDLFLGYLMLDALIGNTDRHHENWGVLVRSGAGGQRVELAPTFDHASSLGRELEEGGLVRFLSGSRNHTSPSVQTYANKARSAIYRDSQERKPLYTLDVFECFSSRAPKGKSAWLDKLSQIEDDSLRAVVERVPAEVLGASGREFASRVLLYNKSRLLGT
jgi:HipA-like C-terminal domain